MEEVKPNDSFARNMVKTVHVEIKDKEYPLRRFTIRQKFRMEEAFGKDLEGWRKSLSSLDSETLLKTLFIFMEPTEDFKQWLDLADVIDCKVEESLRIFDAITFCILAASPEMQESVKKKTEEVGSLLTKMVQEKLIGLGSSTSSAPPTDGDQQMSLT